jgi:putative ABC transport system permease protein
VFLTALDLQVQKYGDARAAVFYQQLVGQLNGQRGVESTLAANPPLRFVMMTGVAPEGQQITGHPDSANFNVVSANYFAVMGIGLSRGRTFSIAEMGRGDAVAIVSEAMVKTYWSGQNPLGKRFLYGPREGDAQLVQVVGVAKDVRSVHLWEPDGPLFYLPANPNKPLGLTVVTKAPSEAHWSGTIRRMVRALDPNVLASVHTLEDNIEHETSPVRVGAALAALLGGLALVLASVGIYGVMTYAISQRTREIGIRMTLGAEGSSVLRLMLSDNMRPVFIGMVVGAAFAALTSRALSRMLLGISALDPIAFIAVAVFLSTVAMLASYLPARRATRVDPMVALRYE